MGRLGSPKAVPTLATVLYDRSVTVRLAAVTSLVSIGDPTAIQELCRTLENSEFLVRREAAVGLGVLAGRDTVLPLQLRGAVPVLQRLCATLSGERVEVRRACRDALQRIEARTGLLKGLPVPAGPGEALPDTLPRPSEAPAEAQETQNLWRQ
jgi:HEAT repeat protein